METSGRTHRLSDQPLQTRRDSLRCVLESFGPISPPNYVFFFFESQCYDVIWCRKSASLATATSVFLSDEILLKFVGDKRNQMK